MGTQVIERMAVEIDGSGDPVILVHGLGGTSNTFWPQMGVLARHRAIRPDLPGSGRSQRPSDPLTIERLADRIAKMADVLNIRRAVLAGHSLGTIVCQHVAAQSRDLVSGMVLFGAFMEPPSAARDGLRNRAKQARSVGMQPIADAVMQGGTAGETRERRPAAAAFVRESLMRQDAEGYAMTCEALAGAHAVDPGRIHCPVLLVAGEEDQVAPPSVAQMMRERLRSGSVTVLPKCGHWMTIERPEECNQALREFLQRNRP